MGLRSLYVAFRRRQIYRRCLAGPAGLIILRYHSVGDPDEVAQYLDPGLSVTPERFREQLITLRESYDVITPDRFEEHISAQTHARPAVAITFDDGYRDNHDVALPILRDLGLAAAFYVTTTPLRSGLGLWISELWRLVPKLTPGPIDLAPGLPDAVPDDAEGRRLLRRRITRWFAGLTEETREAVLDRLAERAGVPRGEGLASSFMTPQQVCALADAGMTVGAHSRTHPHLDHLDPPHHEDEVLGSRADLETILERPVPHFAYPNPSGGGRFGAEARASVAAARFETSVTSTPGPLAAGQDLLRLPRLGVYTGAQEQTLFRLLERHGAASC